MSSDSASPDPAPGSSRLRSTLRDLGLGLLASVVLFLALEGTLRALGLADPERGEDLSRGFDESERMLVPDPDTPGGWVTRVRSDPSAEVHVPPKGDARRVLLFGGSNVDGLRATMLEDFLDERAGEGVLEVYNLGRSGYGTGRVSRLFLSAVEHVEPDVVVIYAGHNEFVERSFRMDLGDSAASGGLLALAAKSHVVHAVLGLITDGPQDPNPATDPGRNGSERGNPDWQAEYQKFVNLSYEETLAVYDQYEANLRRMCRAALERDVAVVLSTVVHNRMAPPFVSGCDGEVGGSPEFEKLRGRIQRLLPDALDPITADAMERRPHGWDYRNDLSVQEHRKLARQYRGGPEVQLGFRPCFGPFADLGRGLGPSELWGEKIWVLLRALDAFWSGALREQHEDDLTKAALLLERALELCPRHSRSLYELGLVELCLGRDELRAVERLELAGRFDHAPRKANELVNDRIRAVAADLADVHFLDADLLFRQRMPAGLVGFEWMYDHCHLNDGAKSVLLRDLCAPILESIP